MGLITERQTARLNLTIYIRCIYYYQPKNDERKVSEANLSRVTINILSPEMSKKPILNIIKHNSLFEILHEPNC